MMKDKEVFLSVIVPAYNEQERLGGTLKRINDYLLHQDYSSEIIVVDDGSTDNTLEVAQTVLKKVNLKSRILSRKQNMGKGYSVKEGVFKAEGKFILFSDADLSTPPEELEKFFPWMERKYDVIIGSRGLADSDIQIHQPWLRETMGKIFNIFVQMLIIRGIWDTQCGFKLFKRHAALEVFKRQRVKGFSFDAETLFIAKKLRYKIREVPIVWRDSPQSRVKILSSPFKMLLELIKIRLTDLTGGYR